MTQQRLKTDQYYSTTDLSIATALALFFTLEVIDKQNPRKAEFLFKRSPELDQIVEAYWRGELKVNPAAFFQQLKIIKTRLYEEGRSW